MQNTNTISSPSDTLNISADSIVIQRYDSICPLQPTVTDSIVIYSPEKIQLSQTNINSNNNLLNSLIFTTVFLIILAFIRLRGKDLLYLSLSTLIKRKKAEIIQNEGISPNLIFYLLSLALSFSVIAVGVIYIVQQKFNLEYSLYIFSGLCFYHFLLLALVRLLGWTFNSRNVSSEVLINLWVYHIMGGLLIAPFIIAIFFVQTFAVIPLLKIIGFSLITLYIIKLVRWLEILFVHRVLIIYMILYLCALEVIPLLILYKFVT